MLPAGSRLFWIAMASSNAHAFLDCGTRPITCRQALGPLQRTSVVFSQWWLPESRFAL